MTAMRVMTGEEWKETLFPDTWNLEMLHFYCHFFARRRLKREARLPAPTRVPGGGALTTSNRRLSPYFTEAIKIKLQDLEEIRTWKLPHHHIMVFERLCRKWLWYTYMYIPCCKMGIDLSFSILHAFLPNAHICFNDVNTWQWNDRDQNHQILFRPLQLICKLISYN